MKDDTRKCAHCCDEFTPPAGARPYSHAATYCGPCGRDYKNAYRAGTHREWHAKRSTLCRCGARVPVGHSKFCSSSCRRSSHYDPVEPTTGTCALPACHNLLISSFSTAVWCSDRCKQIGKRLRAGRPTSVHPHWLMSVAAIGPKIAECDVMSGPVVGPVLSDWPMYGPTRAPISSVKPCESCGVSFVGSPTKRFCSERCFRSPIDDSNPATTKIETGHCRRCSKPYVRPAFRDSSGCCSAECTRRLHRSIRRRKVKAARKFIKHEPYTLREIAERDGWRCHLCGGKVPDRDYAARDSDATIDHLVPQSAGGDDIKSNVALAHNRCNWERGAGGVAQLRLVG